MLAHGKTAVSIVASYKAVKSGYQVAVMAPTAILVRQHLKNFKNLLDNFNITDAIFSFIILFNTSYIFPSIKLLK